MSAMYSPRPRSSRGSSSRGIAWPIPNCPMVSTPEALRDGAAQPRLREPRHHILMPTPQPVPIIDPADQHAVDADAAELYQRGDDIVGGAGQRIAAPTELGAKAQLLGALGHHLVHLDVLDRQHVVAGFI